MSSFVQPKLEHRVPWSEGIGARDRHLYPFRLYSRRLIRFPILTSERILSARVKTIPLHRWWTEWERSCFDENDFPRSRNPADYSADGSSSMRVLRQSTILLNNLSLVILIKFIRKWENVAKILKVWQFFQSFLNASFLSFLYLLLQFYGTCMERLQSYMFKYVKLYYRILSSNG